MSQTAYDEQGIALNGQKYDLSNSIISSYAAEERIPFGRLVSLGTDKDLQVILPAVAGDITSIKAKRGVAIHDHSNENAQDGLDAGVEAKKPVNVMEKGKVYVEVEEAVTPSDDVFVVFSGDKGIFRTDANTDKAAQLADARWVRSSESVDGKLIAVLQLL